MIVHEAGQNGFAGCIPGINEVLRRQGLLANNLCLDPKQKLSPGQREQIVDYIEDNELSDLAPNLGFIGGADM